MKKKSKNFSKGYVREIFTSIQGEGIFAGRYQTFVRFAGCNLRCKYCDTPSCLKKEGKLYFSNKPDTLTGTGKSGDHTKVTKNPVSAELVIDLISKTNPGEVCLTGGEPLEQPDFLLEILKKLKREKIKTYLETNGTLPKFLPPLIPYLDYISVDFKIPSATRQRSFWKEHEQFLEIAKSKNVFVKIVVAAGPARVSRPYPGRHQHMVKDELKKACLIIQKIDAKMPLVIQPVWKKKIKMNCLIEYQKVGLSIIKDVRIIPQLHKILNIK